MEDCVLLDAGSGGRASQRLIQDLFLKYLGNPVLNRLDDAALVETGGSALIMSVDGYTVTPLFFPGASIGSLAINGTVNDVAMLGATPLWLSAAFIIEEGLPMATLEAVVRDMAAACAEAGTRIATGDTKVVPRGACDKLFITTTGIGRPLGETSPSGHFAQPGDVVLISGAIGEHGLAVLAAREDLDFLSAARSDCAPLAKMVANIFRACGSPHVLRDPTRGGVATTLNEIAIQSGVGIEIDENKLPIPPIVRDGCSFLGLDPLYLANEGKCLCILPEAQAAKALEAMRASPYGSGAAIIGRVARANPGKVILNTAIGGQRFLGMLEGEQLPRIC